MTVFPRLLARAVTAALVLLPAGLSASAGPPDEQAAERPNILWITIEDASPHVGAYLDPQALTPRIDALAREGVVYTHAFATAPVCAPARSTIITGVYQTALGTHHMRSSARLPSFVRPFPGYLREAGYYCTNNAKEDYQFTTPPEAWDESSNRAHWRNRPDPDQPFFAVFNFHTTHEGRIRGGASYEAAVADLPEALFHDADDLILPPYYPDTPVWRANWVRYYNLMTAVDRQVAGLLDQLEADGLTEETIVFFFSDHGVGLPRGKRWVYDSGLQVPFVVRIPETFRREDQGRPGTLTDELISFVDLAPTVLRLAGVPIPDHMQGRAFLGGDLSPPRDYVFAGRDRMDERYDMIRAVRDRRYKYIRYYEPYKPFIQYMNTPERGSSMISLRKMHGQGRLPPAAEKLMAQRKPREELFDVAADPYEIHDLAGDPAYRHVLERMRGAHEAWAERTRDVGIIPEPTIRGMEERHDASIFELARRPGGLGLARARAVAAMAARPPAAVPDGTAGAVVDTLTAALADEAEAVRYWAAIGLGNLGASARPSGGALRDALEDPSAAVRIAAARALCLQDEPGPALPVLAEELRGDRQWVRLHAAIVLDEIDEQARPVIDVMQEQMAYRESMLADGKYTVRVLNRALNQLLGTRNEVD